ncbi:MAG: hypothetical protein ACOC6C_01125 [Verrucomicrobiota bacterium]
MKKESQFSIFPSCPANQSSKRTKSGQTMVEYVIIAAIMVLSLTIMALFMYAFKEHGARVLDLVSSEYP